MPEAAPTPTLRERVMASVEALKAENPVLIDVEGLTTITDAMIVCTGTSSRHVTAIAENVIHDAKAAGIRPLGVEGLSESGWVLVDLGDVVLHVMQAQTRALYQLEKLWDLGPQDTASSDTARG